MPLVTSEILPHLSQIPLFEGLGESVLLDLLRQSHACHCFRDEYLFMQGDPASFVYVLKSGRVKILQVTPEGQEVILRVQGSWQMFGAIALVQGEEYPATAQALEECDGFRWTGSALIELFPRYPVLARNALHCMADHTRESQDMFRQMATERVEQRLARALLRLARQLGKKTPQGVCIDIPLTRQDLAEMCGSTIYTVSRILSQWDRSGLIEAGREKVIIRNPHGLVSIAEDFPPSH